ncbi:O-antigen polysaccharide polymerase Wzy [Acetobacterium wieringae]|uniref:O-antigen polysaccharide polymerase Wzy n=1 Tax=Acetobacterium wieringae TaxID=52694 RepID=A0A1F2PJ32_9FIRM|nr:O-antigen polysaccharide polymerase Wzy [Acetobacterium wieringae]OFV71343.1 hypothetical protein ACWI_12570 [Acetobacterium wieringae]
MKTDKLRYYSVVILYFFMLVIFLMISYGSDLSIKRLTYIAIFQLVLSLTILTKRGYGLFSLPSLFLIVSFIFHLSHLILILIDTPVIKWYDLRGFTSTETYIKSIVFTIKVQAFVLLGILLAKKKSKRNEFNNMISQEKESIDKRIIYKVGLILIMIGIIPRLYVDINRFLLFLSGNYLATYNLSLSGVIVVISGMVDTGIILVLIGKKGNPVFCKRVFIFSLIYLTLFMFSGHRASSIITIITLAYVYFDIIKSLNKKSVLFWGFISYLFVFLIGLIADIRMLGDFSIKTIAEHAAKLIISSPLLEILGEFGTSLKSVIYSIMTFPEISSHSYGTNYLKGLLLVFPNIGGFLSSIISEITYVFHFQNYAAMGGSYIGELYYAAGDLGMLFAVLVGLILGHVSNRLLYAKNIKNWMVYALYIVVFPNILWWSRDFFYTMIREIVWTITLMLVLFTFFKSRSKYKSKTNISVS